MFQSRSGKALQPGDPAPTFELPDQAGRVHRLEDYRGDWLVLFFYPRDDTRDCTTEACEFQRYHDLFLLTNIKLLGISTDPVDRHAAFRHRHDLRFPLLSDRGGRVAHRYGSRLNLGLLQLARRHSFIIDPQGRIARIYRNVDARQHAAEVVRELHDLTAGEMTTETGRIP